MKRHLIISNTFYQLIVAIQMKLTLFCEDDVVILISDHSLKANVICQRLNDLKLFSQACYIKTKGLVSGRNKKDKLKDFCDISFKKNNRYSFYLKDIINKKFDEIICYNYNIDIIGLYAILYELNSDIKVSLYEEGVLSYGVTFDTNYRRKIIKYVRKIQRKKDISDAFNSFYCFYPILYKGKLPTVRIDSISVDSKCSSVIRNVFNVKECKEHYRQKFIYFSSVCDFEGGKHIGELKLVKKIVSLVGKENLLIKVHPRDNRNVYKKEGFIVDDNSFVPWEAIQLSGDFSDKVFLTATSGSVLAGSFMSQRKTKTFFMFKLCDISGNSFAQDTSKEIRSLIENDVIKESLGRVKIVDSIEEILE